MSATLQRLGTCLPRASAVTGGFAPRTQCCRRTQRQVLSPSFPSTRQQSRGQVAGTAAPALRISPAAVEPAMADGARLPNRNAPPKPGQPVSAPFGSTCNVMAPPSRVRGASTTLSRGYLRPVTASRGSLSPDSIELLMPSWARIFPWLSIGNSLGRAWTKSPREGPTAMHDTGRHGRGKRRNRRGGDGSTARRQGQFPSLAFPLRLFIVALHPLPPNGRTVGCLRNCMMQARWRRVARVGWLWLLDRLSLCFLFVLPAPAGSVTPVLCPQSRQGRTTDVYDTSGGGVERPSPGNPSGASCLGWVPRNTHDCLRHTMVAVRQCGVK